MLVALATVISLFVAAGCAEGAVLASTPESRGSSAMLAAFFGLVPILLTTELWMFVMIAVFFAGFFITSHRMQKHPIRPVQPQAEQAAG